MRAMRREEWMAFLGEGQRTAKLATVRSDGRPHVAPVWFVVKEDSLVFMTLETSVKGKNLMRDERVMVSVDEEVPPYAFVLIDGVAKISRPNQEGLLPFSRMIAARYMPEGEAEAAATRNAVEGELLVRVPLNKVIANKGVAA